MFSAGGLVNSRALSTGQSKSGNNSLQNSRTDEPLWDRVIDATDNAKKKGALFSMDNAPRVMQDGPIKFVVRVATALQRKPNENPLAKSSQDPFMDPEPELTVRDDLISSTHQLLLNKFNVVDYHLLIVTKEYEPQTDLLNAVDFEAAVRVTQEIDGLLFYNSGKNSGASQPHKHLQFVPLPLVPGDNTLPIDAAINAANAPPNTPFHIPAFKFLHAAAVLDPPLSRMPHTESGRTEAARQEGRMLHALYTRLFDFTGVDYRNEQLRKTGKLSYNFLLSRHWMLIVVRAAEKCGNISVNSLGFSGTILVKSESLFDELRAVGPLAVLQPCAAPLPGSAPASSSPQDPNGINSALASAASPSGPSLLSSASHSSMLFANNAGPLLSQQQQQPFTIKHPSPLRHEVNALPPPRPQSQLNRGPSPVNWPAPQHAVHP